MWTFCLTEVAMQMDVHSTLCCFHTTKKMPYESTRSIASILKSFSSGAVYEFAAKVYFLSFVRAFSELVHKCR